MGLTQTVLQSRALAALTSPHGVDRYLEQVNPMWAAREVRARIVEDIREICERYDLPYNTGRLGKQLFSVASRICPMALPDRRTPSQEPASVDQTPLAA